jgi:excisionase family DNA binding protein
VEGRAAERSTESRPRFHTVDEAAAILRTTKFTLYRAIHAGEFPAVKTRRRYAIPARALDEMEDAAVTTGSVVDAADWMLIRRAA